MRVVIVLESLQPITPLTVLNLTRVDRWAEQKTTGFLRAGRSIRSQSQAIAVETARPRDGASSSARPIAYWYERFIIRHSK